jgi:CHAT domain-containing protein
VDLDLKGKLVILSACQSARGEAVLGEGVMSLARAFFEAGSRTVVGSLLPLRDDETASLMDGFSRGLAGGRSVAGALAEARRAMIASGSPPAAWAGLVVLGDGDLVPRPRGGTHGLLPVEGLALAVSVLVLVVWLRRRRHGTS